VQTPPRRSSAPSGAADRVKPVRDVVAGAYQIPNEGGRPSCHVGGQDRGGRAKPHPPPRPAGAGDIAIGSTLSPSPAQEAVNHLARGGIEFVQVGRQVNDAPEVFGRGERGFRCEQLPGARHRRE